MAAVEDLRIFTDEANDEATYAVEETTFGHARLGLHTAVSIGEVTLVEALAAAKVPLDTCNEDGWAPLHLAASCGHHEVASVLLAYGARVDVRSRCPRAFDGCTPLHVSVAAGDAAMVRLLLERGANPDLRDDCGYTALHLAAQLGHRDIVKCLLMAGARHDVLVGDDTPLGLAERHGRMSTVGLLRQVGART